MKAQGGYSAFHLREQQLKIMMRLLYVNLAVTTNQNSVTDTHVPLGIPLSEHRTSSKCTGNILQDSVLEKLWTARVKALKPPSRCTRVNSRRVRDFNANSEDMNF